MPRRVSFVGLPITVADTERGEMITQGDSGYCDKVLRNIEVFERFLEANPSMREISEYQVWKAFCGQCLNSGLAPATVQGMMNQLRRFGVTVRSRTDARERVERFRLSSGLERLTMNSGPVFRPRTAISNQDLLRSVPCTEPVADDEAERKAFWCLLCVTGNRADNVLRARQLEVNGDNIMVTWGSRKVRGRIRVAYLFAWTRKPPEWVLERWRSLPITPWRFPNPRTIAAAVNQWLKRWGLENCTSTSPRHSLDRVLRKEVIEGRLAREVYERVIDHSLGMGLDHYQGGGEELLAA